MIYKVVRLPFNAAENGNLEAKMNEMAREGWRVIAVTHPDSIAMYTVTFEK